MVSSEWEIHFPFPIFYFPFTIHDSRLRNDLGGKGSGELSLLQEKKSHRRVNNMKFFQ